MQLIVLGSGTVTPSLYRNSSGLLIKTSTNTILVDIGPGTLRRLTEARIDFRAVDFILLTHFHPDHVSDLVPFLFAENYAYGEKRAKPFHIIGPQGAEDFYCKLINVFGHWIIPTDDRRVGVEVSADKEDYLSFENLRIVSTPAAHHYPSVSYRLEADEKSITISGDSDYSENLIRLAASTDALVCDTSFPDGMKHDGHMTPAESAQIAAAAKAKRLVMTHLYPPCDEVDIVEQARDKFDGDIIKAEDLMRIVV